MGAPNEDRRPGPAGRSRLGRVRLCGRPAARPSGVHAPARTVRDARSPCAGHRTADRAGSPGRGAGDRASRARVRDPGRRCPVRTAPGRRNRSWRRHRYGTGTRPPHGPARTPPYGGAPPYRRTGPPRASGPGTASEAREPAVRHRGECVRTGRRLRTLAAGQPPGADLPPDVRTVTRRSGARTGTGGPATGSTGTAGCAHTRQAQPSRAASRAPCLRPLRRAPTPSPYPSRHSSRSMAARTPSP